MFLFEAGSIRFVLSQFVGAHLLLAMAAIFIEGIMHLRRER
jgi:hypothetical protein